MQLPLIPKKYFDVKSKFIPNGKITMSPFTTGLESILLQVKDSTDEKEKIAALKQIIESCSKTPIDAGKLPIFVVEELFIRLVQNSISELVDLAYICNNQTTKDGKEVDCGNKLPLQIDLRNFVIKEKEGHTDTVLIDNDIGIKFKYPTIDMAENDDKNLSEIIKCIELVFNGDEVTNVEEVTSEELVSFWKQLTLKQKKDVYDKFYDTIPHMYYKTNLKCDKCGYNHNVEFKSTIDLFQ